MFKYSTKDVSRMWTRKTWKQMSRWLRLVQRRMDIMRDVLVKTGFPLDLIRDE